MATTPPIPSRSASSPPLRRPHEPNPELGGPPLPEEPPLPWGGPPPLLPAGADGQLLALLLPLWKPVEAKGSASRLPGSAAEAEELPLFQAGLGSGGTLYPTSTYSL
jgi:hypothetical protein